MDLLESRKNSAALLKIVSFNRLGGCIVRCTHTHAQSFYLHATIFQAAESHSLPVLSDPAKINRYISSSPDKIDSAAQVLIEDPILPHPPANSQLYPPRVRFINIRTSRCTVENRTEGCICDSSSQRRSGRTFV